MTKDMNDDALEALFNAGRSRVPEPSPDFLARLEADAAAHVPVPQVASPAPAPRRNWFTGFFTASGLSGAALAGVWIGFAMPETLDPYALITDDTVALSSFLPAADLGVVFDE